MVTTAKPIIIDKEVNLTQYLYQYINYYIAIYKDTATATGVLDRIYYGKYFVTDPSRIRMNITEAIKNNINKVDYNISMISQDWMPDNILPYTTDTQLITGVQSIENEHKFETARIDVYFLEPGSGNRVITTRQFDITSYFSPEWYDEFQYSVPNRQNDGKIEEANRTGILPRIPYISTDKYYINFNFNRNRNSQPIYAIGNDTTGKINVNTTNVGVYNFSMSLYRLFKFIHQPADYDITTLVNGGAAMIFDYQFYRIEGGNATSEYKEMGGLGAVLPVGTDKANYNIEANGKAIVRVDNCYSRYYAAWITPMGEWQSQPLDYMTVNRTNENLTFNSLRGYDYTAHTGSHGELTLRKTRLTNEEQKLYSTMMFSPYILIYDTEKDRSYLGTYQGDVTYNDRQRNNREFELRIKEVEKIKY